MSNPKRAMWLMNHSTLRKFEVPLLEALGYEVYLPKKFPYDEGNLSASLDFSRDSNLSIPAADLETLNKHDFYGGLTPEIGEIASKYFDVAFFGFFPKQLAGLIRHFRNECVMRPFGLATGVTYTDVTVASLKPYFLHELQQNKHRFWFGQAYDHLAEIERGVFLDKSVTLPLGLDDARVTDEWTGEDAKVLFVCPRIGSSPYFNNIYHAFLRLFGNLPYVIGGAQPIAVPDPNVVGMLPREDYDRMMRRTRVMFYHSREMRHLHYHPLEAVRLGMPLVFMAGGMLDLLGGRNLPGRCDSEGEAQAKINALLKGDAELLQSIRSTQHVLLHQMSRQFCEAGWKEQFPKIEASIQRNKERVASRKAARKRVAVFLPAPYRGGTLNMVKLIAKMLKRGSIEIGREIDVVFGYPESDIYTPDDWRDLALEGIETRTFKTAEIDGVELNRIQSCLGQDQRAIPGTFTLHKDGTYDFLDCDFWLLGSDRYNSQIAPLRPYCVFAHDYLQRYFSPLMGPQYERGFIETARNAIAVLANTPHTIEDAIHYVGKNREDTILVPHVAELDQMNDVALDLPKRDHFVWTTNIGPHKNHLKTLKALHRYYYTEGGTLSCHVTGVDTEKLDPTTDVGGALPQHIEECREYLRRNPQLAAKIRFLGDISNTEYATQLATAQFLVHNVIMDNGTLCAVEAAYVGTPTLSSDYPPMRYLSERYGLQCQFFDANDVIALAKGMIFMEQNCTELSSRLPTKVQLQNFSWRRVSAEFFNAIRPALGA